MADVVRAFSGGEELEGDRHQGRDLIEVPRPGRAQERFQLGECELDRIEIGTVRRQKSELRADRFDRRPNLGLFVDGQVVEDDDITWPEGGHQDLLDIRAKTVRIDRAIKDGRRSDGIDSQGGNDRAGFPMTARRVIAEPGPARTPSVTA
jgi:hypothetical protein